MPAAAESAGISGSRQVFKKENRFVGRVAILAAIGGFLFGYDTGIISIANVYASKSLGFGSLGESWTVGALLLGAISGAALADGPPTPCRASGRSSWAAASTPPPPSARLSPRR